MDNKYIEDKNIDLMDMIYHIFVNWRIFVIVAVMGLALGCGYKYYSNIKYNESLEISKNQKEADLGLYLKNLICNDPCQEQITEITTNLLNYC